MHFFRLQLRARAKAKDGSQTGSQVGSLVKVKEKNRMAQGKARMERAKEREEKEKALVTDAVNMATSSEIAQMQAKE